MPTYQLVDITNRGARLTLTTEELAHRWGIHPESLNGAVRNGTLPVRPIIPGAGPLRSGVADHSAVLAGRQFLDRHRENVPYVPRFVKKRCT